MERFMSSVVVSVCAIKSFLYTTLSRSYNFGSICASHPPSTGERVGSVPAHRVTHLYVPVWGKSALSFIPLPGRGSPVRWSERCNDGFWKGLGQHFFFFRTLKVPVLVPHNALGRYDWWLEKGIQSFSVLLYFVATYCFEVAVCT